MSAPLIYLIAGEASGDALGAGLMRELKAQCPGVRFAGIGGEAMATEDLQSIFPYSDLSIMGFWEIVPHIPKLLKRLTQTVEDIIARQPDVIVTIDSPGFNFRLAKGLKSSHIKRIHYVAPSVWAYKPERAKKTAQLFDMLLTLLPFEPPYFEKEGLRTVFVGHPVLWKEWKGDAAAFRARHAIAPGEKILLLLPGSRAGEVKRHLPLFLEAAASLPEYKVVILASPQVRGVIESLNNAGMIIDIAEKEDAFAAADMALSKSGTVTLELAAAGVLMVVAHKVSALSAWLIRRMIRIPYASLVNIAANKEIIPELLQERCTVSAITNALKNLNKETQLGEYKEALSLLRGSLECYSRQSLSYAGENLLQSPEIPDSFARLPRQAADSQASGMTMIGPDSAAARAVLSVIIS